MRSVLERPLIAAALGLVVLQALVVLRYSTGPAPQPADAPATTASAGRAIAALERILGDQRPHPIGSVANAAVGARLRAELSGLGLEVHEELAPTGWTRDGAAVELRNLFVRLPGRERGRPLLLATHYDSVPAGPGAGDPGACVGALLETARALRAGPPLRNDVILLFTDGEEFGLLGAEAFAAHAWVRENPVVVNFDARGTTGPSMMFETGKGDAWLVEHAVSELPRPVTGSAFVAAYDRMPNDTDFTVFKGRGLTGLNFAFIGGAARYHTAEDDLAHLDARSVQHHADNALAVARALGDADLEEAGSGGAAVFFDVFALFVVSWRSSWAGWLALSVFALALGAHRRAAGSRSRAVLLTLATIGGSLVAAAAGGQLAAWLFGALGLIDGPFVEPRWPFVACYWAVAAATVWGVARLFLRRLEPATVAWTVWATWGALATVLGFALPGVSYLFVVPVACFAVATVAARRAGPRAPTIAVLCGAWGAGLVWLPFLGLAPVALGVELGAICGPMAIALTPLLPLLAGRPLRAEGAATSRPEPRLRSATSPS